jgi:hypothetical protein
MYRFWSGTQWTEQVNNGASNSTDAMDAAGETVPPVPGSAAAEPEAAAQPAVAVTQKSGSTFGIVLGVVAVIVAIIILLVVILNSGDNGGSDPTTPVTTPATTVAPDTTSAG